MTQIFITSKDFDVASRQLDNKRLNKNMVEATQVYTQNVYGYGGQGNLSPYKMWFGYESMLSKYIISMYKEWQKRIFDGVRGGSVYHKSGEFILNEVLYNRIDIQNPEVPKWFDNEKIFSSYRAALLEKYPEWYSQWGWSEIPDVPTIDKKGNKSYHYIYGLGKE